MAKCEKKIQKLIKHLKQTRRYSRIERRVSKATILIRITVRKTSILCINNDNKRNGRKRKFIRIKSDHLRAKGAKTNR